ncbi:MAG: class I SAM-dependent methyltransferase [Solirubrobacteraceae bacterium]
MDLSPQLASVADYYADRLREHGTSARGVDWSSESSQGARFSQLLRLVDGESNPRIIDWGCGYGALAQRLIAEQRSFLYTGFDVCTPMVVAARRLVTDPRCRFVASREELQPADFTVASGIFNVRIGTEEADWQRHVVHTLDQMVGLSRGGFAFNMLTRYADEPRMRDDLHYVDPGDYFRLCKERYSRNVALLHDYSLFEFTIIVRLGEAPKPLVDGGVAVPWRP